jgi:hypothetical protein
MAEALVSELRQLGRSRPYTDEIDAFQGITGLFARSIEDEDRRVMDVLERILATASIIPLEADTIRQAAAHGAATKVSPQDSIIYFSVLRHLASARDPRGAFISKDRKGFDDPDIVESLESRGCKMLFRFADGYHYVEHLVNTDWRE